MHKSIVRKTSIASLIKHLAQKPLKLRHESFYNTEFKQTLYLGQKNIYHQWKFLAYLHLQAK